MIRCRYVSGFLHLFLKTKITSHPIFKTQKGICLNHPAQELLSKVHADKRIRIFEYQISYTEL